MVKKKTKKKYWQPSKRGARNPKDVDSNIRIRMSTRRLLFAQTRKLDTSADAHIKELLLERRKREKK